MIESSNSETIFQTANELLMGNQEDLIRVLGTSFSPIFIEADANKGLLKGNHINISSPHFGVQAASVF